MIHGVYQHRKDRDVVEVVVLGVKALGFSFFMRLCNLYLVACIDRIMGVGGAVGGAVDIIFRLIIIKRED
ncbi:hypothetical protein BZA77DRAFT_315874 [Pyronema omphalodes]|nr:hypothetical protein BZA77DRAFT_315874 [Pyronema omphalodes]